MFVYVYFSISFFIGLWKINFSSSILLSLSVFFLFPNDEILENLNLSSLSNQTKKAPDDLQHSIYLLQTYRKFKQGWMIHSTINSGNFLDFLHFKYPAGLSFPCLKHLETKYWGKSGWVHKCTLHKCTFLLSLPGLTASLRGTLPFLSILSSLRPDSEILTRLVIQNQLGKFT